MFKNSKKSFLAMLALAGLSSVAFAQDNAKQAQANSADAKVSQPATSQASVSPQQNASATSAQNANSAPAQNANQNAQAGTPVPPPTPEMQGEGGGRGDFRGRGRGDFRGGRGGGLNPMDNPNLRRVDDNGEMQGPFYFVDANPVQVLQILEALMKKTILQSQGLPAVKINFVSKKQLPRDEAISALTSLLSLNGVAVLPLDDKFMRAVPSIGVARQAPALLDSDISKMTPSQTFYTRLYELKFIDTASVQQKLKAFMSMDGMSAIESFPRSNVLLITDTLVNLQRIDLFLKTLDQPAQLREDVEFISVKHIGVSDLREKLMSMQNDLLRKYFENTTIEVDSRSNQIVVITQKGNMPIIKKFIEGLDVEAEPLLKNEVFYIRYGQAEQIQSVLNQIITQQRNIAYRNNQQRNQAIYSTAHMINTVANRNKNAGTSLRLSEFLEGDTGAEFSDYVQVVAHSPSSSIVVYGTPTDIKQISGIIKKLDIAIDQVRIDVIITEVNLTENQVSGLSSFGIAFNNPIANPGSVLQRFGKANQVSGSVESEPLQDSTSPAFSLGFNESSMEAILNVARQNQDVKVLSSPSITTTHSKAAEVNVSELYPMITGSTTDLANPSATRTQVTREEIGIRLIVTPYVGTDGTIQLDIQQNVDSIARYTEIDDNLQPVVSQRKAESTISAHDGEVIVFAGLQHVETNDNDGGVWLLSDIPVIGEFFKPSGHYIKRRELVIFIRPTVIKSKPVEQAISGEDIKNTSTEYELSNFLRTRKFYPESEYKTNYEEFEDNRAYKHLFKDPLGFIAGEKIVKEGSTIDAKNRLKARNEQEALDAQKAESEKEKNDKSENSDAKTSQKVESTDAQNKSQEIKTK